MLYPAELQAPRWCKSGDGRPEIKGAGALEQTGARRGRSRAAPRLSVIALESRRGCRSPRRWRLGTRAARTPHEHRSKRLDRIDERARLGKQIGALYKQVDDLLDFCQLADTGTAPLQDYRQRKWDWDQPGQVRIEPEAPGTTSDATTSW